MLAVTKLWRLDGPVQRTSLGFLSHHSLNRTLWARHALCTTVCPEVVTWRYGIPTHLPHQLCWMALLECAASKRAQNPPRDAIPKVHARLEGKTRPLDRYFVEFPRSDCNQSPYTLQRQAQELESRERRAQTSPHSLFKQITTHFILIPPRGTA